MNLASITASFLTGVTAFSLFTVYMIAYRYSNFPSAPRQSNTSHFIQSVKRVDWKRTALLTIATGCITVIAWHGVNDIITTITRASF